MSADPLVHYVRPAREYHPWRHLRPLLWWSPARYKAGAYFLLGACLSLLAMGALNYVRALSGLPYWTALAMVAALIVYGLVNTYRMLRLMVPVATGTGHATRPEKKKPRIIAIAADAKPKPPKTPIVKVR